MPIAYYGASISPHIDKTPEGFVICREVPVARTGQQIYLARELGLDAAGQDPDREVTVERMPEDVFAPVALASLEGKPVTDGHPPQNLDAANYALYYKGHVENVRRCGDYVVADLYINDPALASDVLNRVKREVSCGYQCDYVPAGSGYRQKNIRLNHVAVVPKGRAGHMVAIHDAAPHRAEKGNPGMNFWKELFAGLFGAAADAGPDGLPSMMAAAPAQDLEPTPAGAVVQDGAPAPAAPAQPAAPAADADPLAALSAQLCEIQQLLQKLLAGKEPTARLADETDIDKAIEHLAGKAGPADPAAALAIPVEDPKDGCGTPANLGDSAVMVQVLRGLRPVVAGIQDAEVKSDLAAKLLALVDDGSQLSTISRAAADAAAAAQKRTAAPKTDFVQRCADSEAAYAALNPHNHTKKEDN